MVYVRVCTQGIHHPGYTPPEVHHPPYTVHGSSDGYVSAACSVRQLSTGHVRAKTLLAIVARKSKYLVRHNSTAN